MDNLPANKEIFIVYPTYLKEGHIGEDFGSASEKDLIDCFKNKTTVTRFDLSLGSDLWQAYKSGDLVSLKNLSNKQSPCFPYLKEVCEAHIERFSLNGEKGRPERAVEKIVQVGHRNFSSVFNEFFKREGIYGFGDSQVKQIYDKLLP